MQPWVLATLVHDENVSTVVPGRVPVSGWRRLIGRAPADELMALVDKVAVHLIQFSRNGGGD
jgi:hypothetical protein